MFTGIIQDIGTVSGVRTAPYGASITVHHTKDLRVEVSDSVAVSGTCLTVTAVSEGVLTFDCVRETLERSTLRSLRPGVRVNLEPALRVGDALGGHFVQGHVDGTGRIQDIRKDVADRTVRVACAPELLRYVAEKGSVTLDGISLTVASVDAGTFTVKVIPFTWDATTLTLRRSGDEVNIETDVLAKYVARLAEAGRGQVTLELLSKSGFV